jgi:glucose/arabinose dehydrogenase
MLGALTTVLVATAVLASCHGGLHAHPVATGLEFPAAIALDPNNREIWYGERFTGEIHRHDVPDGRDALVFTISNIATSGEQGLLGLALHPDYPAAPFLYAYASRDVGGLRNQVLKIMISNGVGTSAQVIMDDPGIASNHNGGRIAFGPDRNLYVVIGDHQSSANAQTINGNTNLAGKVLRMTPDGGVPADNPFPGSVVWAFGIRNSFGFTFDPAQGNMWLTDNGPTCNDEVNRITGGGNFAWGSEATCSTPPAAPQNTNQSGPQPRILPQRFYPAMGITGAAFCRPCGVGQLDDRLLFSAVNNGQVHSLALDASRTSVVSDTIVYDHPRGVLSMESRPGQPMYFSDPSGIYMLTLAG